MAGSKPASLKKRVTVDSSFLTFGDAAFPCRCDLVSQTHCCVGNAVNVPSLISLASALLFYRDSRMTSF